MCSGKGKEPGKINYVPKMFLVLAYSLLQEKKLSRISFENVMLFALVGS